MVCAARMQRIAKAVFYQFLELLPALIVRKANAHAAAERLFAVEGAVLINGEVVRWDVCALILGHDGFRQMLGGSWVVGRGSWGVGRGSGTCRCYWRVGGGWGGADIAEMPSLRSRDGRNAEFHAAT